MSDVMPNGVTPIVREKDNIKEQFEKFSSKEELTRLDETLSKFEKNFREFNTYQRSIDEEIRMLRNAGASKSDLKEYIDSVAPLFDERAEQYEKDIKGLNGEIKQIYGDKEFADIKQHKQFDDLLKKMDSQFETEQEQVKEQSQLFSDMKESLGGMATQGSLGLIDAFLGPLKLITDPLQELTGFNVGESLIGGFQGLFGSKEDDEKKIAPRRSRLLQEGVEGSAAVYTVDKLAEEEEGGMLDQLFEGFDIGDALQGGGGLASILGKALPIVAIAGSLVWAVIDAITAVGMAEDWGVSSTSAAIGGFLGGTSSGWEGAFAGAGKFGLMGAGIGFLSGGPVGALIGGLIGAAIGGILGFIGGENLAKGFDAIGQWFTDRWNDIVGFFTSIFGEGGPLDDVWTFVSTFFLSIWDYITKPFIAVFDSFMKSIQSIVDIFMDEETSVVDKILGIAWEMIMFVPNMLIGWFGGIFESISGFFLDLFVGTKDAEGKRTKKSLMVMGGEALMDIGIMAMDWLGNLFIGIWEGAVSVASNIGKFIDEWVIQPVAGFFTRLWSDALGVVDDVTTWIMDWVVTPVGSFFGSIWAGLKDIGGFLYDWIIKPIGDFFTGIGNFLMGQLNKVGQLGADIFDEGKSRMFDAMSIAGIETQSVLGDQRLTEFADAGILSRDEVMRLGGPMGDENLLKPENIDLLTKVLIGLGDASAEQIARATGQSEPQILKQMGFSDSEIVAMMEEEASPFSVEDAIIKSDGTIIRTDPSDTIIATKNDPTMLDKEIDNQLQIIYPEYTEDQGNSSEMLEALYEIATILREKNFNNIIQTNIGSDTTDFNGLREGVG